MSFCGTMAHAEKNQMTLHISEAEVRQMLDMPRALRAVEDAPDKVLFCALALVEAKLVVQIIGGAAGSDLSHKLGDAFNVAIRAYP